MEYASTHSAQSSHPVGIKDLHTLYLAGGCFWGLEAYLKRLPGIHNTEVGYANGTSENPSYEDVCYRDTGHAETVAVTYDRNTLPTQTLVEAFFNAIDPTTLNRQGNDCGSQYRSGIYYLDASDKVLIEQERERQQTKTSKPIVTEVEPLAIFCNAEDYHQDYLDKNPSGYCHIDPKAADRFIAEKTQNEETANGAINETMPDENGIEEEAMNTTIQNLDKAILAQDYQSPNDHELREKLSEEQYRVTKQNATEFPYANEYNDSFERGLYVDITSGEPLFTSMDKFESGCGWPSFSQPIAEEVITEHEDKSLFTTRTEVRSRAGNAHLGHVFPDGPKEFGGLRYCINSASLRFIPYRDLDEEGYGYLKSIFDEAPGYSEKQRHTA